jgi:CubicO group peptidase (beta-lactamase class C family)
MDAQVSQDSATWPSQFAEIDRYAEALLRADRVPGASIAIVHRDRLVHLRNFGVDQQERAITGSTSFVLGSMSKSITAVAVMQLVERGKVVLDAPVRTYLPGFRVASADSGATITVRQLLLHTSGLPHAVARGSRRTLADHVEALRTVAPLREPGSAHAYASPNYLVLGRIVEVVSGQPFGQYVEQNILVPWVCAAASPFAQAISSGFASGRIYAFGFPITRRRREPDRLPAAG